MFNGSFSHFFLYSLFVLQKNNKGNSIYQNNNAYVKEKKLLLCECCTDIALLHFDCYHFNNYISHY